MTLAAMRSRFAPLTAVVAPARPPVPLTAAHDARHDAARCVTCGELADTPFCPHCGERRAGDHAYTIRALAADVWDFVTPADGRTLRTVWTLVRHPGELTAAYMRGERRPFLTPIGLFFFVNAGYFVYVGLTHQPVFNTPLRVHVESSPHSAIARPLVEARIAARHTTYAEYERKFNTVVDTQSKTLIVAMVPGFAALVALAGWRRGRGALHHLAFSFHAMTAFLVGWIVGTYAFAYPVAFAARLLNGGHRVQLGEGVVVTLIFVPFLVWLALALRRVYGDGPVVAVVKTGALTFGLLMLLFAYRALLFFTAYWAT